jgi:hypothetical protein
LNCKSARLEKRYDCNTRASAADLHAPEIGEEKVDSVREVTEHSVAADELGATCQRCAAIETRSRLRFAFSGVRVLMLAVGLLSSSRSVHLLRDERTRKYNFDPYLRFIHQPDQIDLNVLTKFTPSSEDEALHAVTAAHKCRFASSTSSISPILAQLIYVVSRFRPLQLNALSSAFRSETSRPVSERRMREHVV